MQNAYDDVTDFDIWISQKQKKSRYLNIKTFFL